MTYMEKAEQIAHIVIDAYEEVGVNTDGVNIQTMIYFLPDDARAEVMKVLRDCVIEAIHAKAG